MGDAGGSVKVPPVVSVFLEANNVYKPRNGPWAQLWRCYDAIRCTTYHGAYSLMLPRVCCISLPMGLVGPVDVP
jgi:hypothetical protein